MKIVHRRSRWALPAALMLCGCSPPAIDVTVFVEKGRLMARLSQDWGLFFSHKNAPCVRLAQLVPHSDLDAPVWKIEAKGDVQCLHLSSFAIGGPPPDGFEEVVPLAPGTKGMHRLDVLGIGGGEADLAL